MAWLIVADQPYHEHDGLWGPARVAALQGDAIPGPPTVYRTIPWTCPLCGTVYLQPVLPEATP